MAATQPAPSLVAEVSSVDIIRLIQHHLIECGLHESCRTLCEESGIGAVATHANLKSLCSTGQWGEVQDILSKLDPGTVPLSSSLLADVHEMTVLELAEIGEIDLALATLRLLCEAEYERYSGDIEKSGGRVREEESIFNRKSMIEMKILNLESIRKTAAKGVLLRSTLSKDMIPKDYFGENKVSKQMRRERIGDMLADAVPKAVRGRLVTLLQQAVKWQSYTGQLPIVYESELAGDDIDTNVEQNLKKKKRRKKTYRIDIVMGEVPPRSGIEKTNLLDTGGRGTANVSTGSSLVKAIPSKECGKIKFGKSSFPECAVFLPDGEGLVTGSSDGFVEVWDTRKWGKLRTHDLLYQKNDELMMHKTSVLSVAYSRDGEMLATGSADGTVKVWKLLTGICLRELEGAHSKGVLCICFQKDGSHILTGSQDYLCREFGLQTSRMLKEFRAHCSYVNTCTYLYDNSTSDLYEKILVASGSADGSVIIWDGNSAEVLHVLRPTVGVTPGVSLATSVLPEVFGEALESRSVHTVLSLHSFPLSFILVSLSSKAFLVNYDGVVHRVYERNDGPLGSDSSVFVAAAVSPSNKLLFCATQDGTCVCFSVESGEQVQSFDLDIEKEVTGLLHHPHQSILASYSNRGTKGLIKLWE